MNRSIACATLLTALTSLAPTEAYAWSRDGHRIVCRIAYRLLDAPTRDEIDRLTSAYRNPDGQPVTSYFDACAWADDVRAKANSSASWRRFAMFETWHYANVPRTTTRLTSPPCQVPCVINAIPAHIDSLKASTTDLSKTEALFFLSHWLGDLHQPLHVGFADDRGGNDVRPIAGGFYSTSNLHAAWDAGIPGKMFASADWKDYADSLASKISTTELAEWIRGTPTDWAQESYDIVTSQLFEYCEWQEIGGARTCATRPGSRMLGESYQREFGPVVVRRLQQAGVRLAEILRMHMERTA
jgi:hypothetical protein